MVKTGVAYGEHLVMYRAGIWQNDTSSCARVINDIKSALFGGPQERRR